MTKLYGSLEAGGTKFVCAVGDENNNVISNLFFNSLFFYYITKGNGSLLFLIEKTTLIYV